jgi:hypothetical protein
MDLALLCVSRAQPTHGGDRIIRGYNQPIPEVLLVSESNGLTIVSKWLGSLYRASRTEP